MYTQPMADKKTQKTPKGVEIPVPKGKDFLKNLKQSGTPKSSTPSSPKK